MESTFGINVVKRHPRILDNPCSYVTVSKAISFPTRANLFLGVCPFHFYDICIGHKLTFIGSADKRTRYNADHLIFSVNRKIDFDEKIQG